MTLKFLYSKNSFDGTQEIMIVESYLLFSINSFNPAYHQHDSLFAFNIMKTLDVC